MELRVSYPLGHGRCCVILIDDSDAPANGWVLKRRVGQVTTALRPFRGKKIMRYWVVEIMVESWRISGYYASDLKLDDGDFSSGRASFPLNLQGVASGTIMVRVRGRDGSSLRGTKVTLNLRWASRSEADDLFGTTEGFISVVETSRIAHLLSISELGSAITITTDQNGEASAHPVPAPHYVYINLGRAGDGDTDLSVSSVETDLLRPASHEPWASGFLMPVCKAYHVQIAVADRPTLDLYFQDQHSQPIDNLTVIVSVKNTNFGAVGRAVNGRLSLRIPGAERYDQIIGQNMVLQCFQLVAGHPTVIRSHTWTIGRVTDLTRHIRLRLGDGQTFEGHIASPEALGVHSIVLRTPTGQTLLVRLDKDMRFQIADAERPPADEPGYAILGVAGNGRVMDFRTPVPLVSGKVTEIDVERQMND